MKILTAINYRPLIIILGLGIVLSWLAWFSLNSTQIRVCKPVVPQIIIESANIGPISNTSTLLLLYDESGSGPFGRKTFTNNARISSCRTIDTRCIASRARYEISVEGSRSQSIQIRGMNGDGNPILGGIQWEGPSYPDRVKIKCDLENSNPREACVLDKLEYSVDLENSGKDGGAPHVQRHDQCSPNVSIT